MKIDCILTSCNLNNVYLDFIPIFIKSWKKLLPCVDVKIILISETIPSKFTEYSDYIILFNQVENISTSFISQYIRILYPCILSYNNGVLITDIDMLPMNSKYYSDNIKNISDDKFIYYRNVLMNDYNQIAICYNIATPSTWSDIISISSIDDIIKRIKNVHIRINYDGIHGGNGWATDQLDLYKYVNKWNYKYCRFISLQDKNTGYLRLDRGTFILTNTISNNIKKGLYSDYHACRPYSQYKKINDTIVDLLPDNNLAFVSFTTSDYYCKLGEIMIKSVHAFSKYRILLFCVDFDAPEYSSKYPNLICHRIDWNKEYNIFYLKPRIIYESMIKFNIKYGVYIETDDILNYNIDDIFQECYNVDKYPLSPIHPLDPNNQKDIMDRFNVSTKSQPYVHGHVIFSYKCIDFIKEWFDTCINSGSIGANYDETILNVLLWKYKVNFYINYIYDPYYGIIYNENENKILNNKIVSKAYNDIIQKYSTKMSPIYMYHGSKDVKTASNLLDKIIFKHKK